MNKARALSHDGSECNILPGSLADPVILLCPISPTTPFEFPFVLAEATYCDFSVTDALPQPFLKDSVSRVVGLPCVCGLSLEEDMVVRVTRATTASERWDNPLLMDGGANICITGVLDLLVDVISIAPLPILVATKMGAVSLDDCYTKQGLLPLMLDNGTIYYQPCYYCKNAVETIISPQAILAASDVLVRWTQTGNKDGCPGKIRFDSDSGLYSITMTLKNHDGLYYCPTDVFTVDRDPVRCSIPTIRWVTAPTPPSVRRHMDLPPVPYSRLAESKLWLLRLGSPGENQLDMLPGNATGIPHSFMNHPFRFVDWKEEARVQRQSAGKSADRTTEVGRRFYMVCGFMRASTSDYSRPNKQIDRVVASWDGYSSYLLVVDEASRHIWVFLTKIKEPPLDIVDTFLTRFGHVKGGSVRNDQGGELARSFDLSDMLLRQHKYVVEPTGADSPLQNGAVEIYNTKLAVRTWTLLFGSGLPAQYWLSALIHAVYLHNWLVHSVTRKTPFEAYFKVKPDLLCLKTFGSRVCVKRSGNRRSKLDRHDFKGIFLGYTATDQNIIYLDLESSRVKTSHHAQFDEAWYLQASRPPAAQLLYDLGVVPNEPPSTDTATRVPHHGVSIHPPVGPTKAPRPPMDTTKDMEMKLSAPIESRKLHLPLRSLMDAPPRTFPARAVHSKQISQQNVAADLVEEYKIGKQDMALIYMSPDPYHEAFEQTIDLRKFDLRKHPTGGLVLYDRVARVHLTSISPGSPAARIHNWRLRKRGAWLIKVGDRLIGSSDDVVKAFEMLRKLASTSTTLLFLHPEVRPNLSQDGVPIVSSAPFSQNTHDQLNNRWEFSTVAEHLRSSKSSYELVPSGDVLNVVTRVMRLTRGKLMKQTDWDEWQASEFLQLNQYDAQGMFGQPVAITEGMACFHSVRTYAIKALDSRKKARWACDGSPRSGQAKILDKTYANCVDQTSSRLFYAVAAAENLLIFGADVLNAFAEAPPPKQGFYVHPDRAFREWWVIDTKRPPIPEGAVIPILSAMQGHPESPHLWEKHTDAILRDYGLVPTAHEPCLYSGLVNGNRVIFKHQVDDFAITAPDKRTANILLDMIDDRLTIPMKHQGFLDMYNGIDILQIHYYSKISCTTYTNKICEKYLLSWMRHFTSTDDRHTPLPSDPAWMKKFNSAVGDPDPTVQDRLAKTMESSYRSGVGELIWAMTTCRPDMAFTSVKDPDPKIQAKLAKSMDISYRSGVGELILGGVFIKKLASFRHKTQKFFFFGGITPWNFLADTRLYLRAFLPTARSPTAHLVGQYLERDVTFLGLQC